MMAHVFNLMRDPKKEPPRGPEDFLTQREAAPRQMTSGDMRRQVMSLHAALTGRDLSKRG